MNWVLKIKLAKRFLPDSLCHSLPYCPLPAVWTSENTQNPSIGLVFDINSNANLLVESTVNKWICSKFRDSEINLWFIFALFLINYSKFNFLIQSKARSKALLNEESEFLDLIIDAIQDIKGKNIIQIDLRHLPDAPTRFFIICEGESSTQIKAIANNVARRVKEESNYRANHVEG